MVSCRRRAAFHKNYGRGNKSGFLKKGSSLFLVLGFEKFHNLAKFLVRIEAVAEP